VDVVAAAVGDIGVQGESGVEEARWVDGVGRA